MIANIINELTAKKNTSEVKSKEMLSWPKWMEAQSSQKALVDSLKMTNNLTW